MILIVLKMCAWKMNNYGNTVSGPAVLGGAVQLQECPVEESILMTRLKNFLLAVSKMTSSRSIKNGLLTSLRHGGRDSRGMSAEVFCRILSLVLRLKRCSIFLKIKDTIESILLSNLPQPEKIRRVQ